VQLLGNTTDLRPRYIHALEVSNRVVEENFLDIISLLQTVIDAQTALRSNIYFYVINAATSTTVSVYSALNDFVTMANNELKLSVQQLINNYEKCYNQNVNYVIQSVTGQIATSVQQFASLQMILGQSSNISSDGYSYLNNAANQVTFVQNLLVSATEQLSFTAFYPNCPQNPLQTNCLANWVKLNNTIANFSTDLVQLSPFIAGLFSVTMPQVTTADDVSIDGANYTEFHQTMDSSTFPAYVTENINDQFSTTQLPPAQQAKQALNSSNMKTKASEQVMTDLSTCLTSYQSVLNNFQGSLNTISLDISVTSVVSTSTILSPLNTDGDMLQGLLDGYLAGSLSAVEVANRFLGVQSTNVLLNIAQTLSAIDESTMTILQNLINHEKSNLKQSYSQIMTSLAQLDTFMPNADSTIDNFARNFSLWRKPMARMQSQDVKLYNIN